MDVETTGDDGNVESLSRRVGCSLRARVGMTGGGREEGRHEDDARRRAAPRRQI
jgi:hypothetical protein